MMLKNKAQKTEKSQKLTPKWLQKIEGLWGKIPLGRLWWSKAFCDEKVSPQRSQSAPKNDKWTNISEKIAKTELKTAPKKNPRVEKSFKSEFFRKQKRFLETELKPLEKHKK